MYNELKLFEKTTKSLCDISLSQKFTFLDYSSNNTELLTKSKSFTKKG